MNIFKKSFAAAAMAGLFATGAQALTLDFDTANTGSIGPGNITGSEFTDFGVVITGGAGTNLALFNSNCGTDFDSSCTTTATDGDLATGPAFGTAPQGNVLINNGGTSANPNDNASGGLFNFAFLSPVTFSSIDILDLDESNLATKIAFTFGFAGGASQMFDGTGGVLQNPGFSGDNSLRTFTFDLLNVTSLSVELKNISGAISSVSYAPVPLPAALPLLLAGVGALGIAARRRKAA